MKTFSDQNLARRLLEARKHGYTFGLFYRRSATRYILLVSVCAGGMAILALAQIWPPFWLVLGMVVGSLLRDIGWVISIRRTWPFSERITDWDKVQRFADERPSA